MNINELMSQLEEVNAKIDATEDKADLLIKRADILSDLGSLTKERGLVIQALTDLNRALDARPRDALTLVERGTIYYVLDEQDKALEDFSKSLSIEQTSRAFYNRGVSRWYRLEKKGITELKLDPDATKEAASVLGDYRDAIQLDPSNHHALFDIGVVYMRLGEFGDAIDAINKTLMLTPNDYQCFFNRAVCYENLEQPRYSNKRWLQRAIDDYDTVIKLNPEFMPAYFNQALCYELLSDKGRYKDRHNTEVAIQRYTEILRRDPYNVAALYNRGWAYENSRDTTKAIEDFEKYVKTSPDPFTVGQLSVHIEKLRAARN